MNAAEYIEKAKELASKDGAVCYVVRRFNRYHITRVQPCTTQVHTATDGERVWEHFPNQGPLTKEYTYKQVK